MGDPADPQASPSGSLSVGDVVADRYRIDAVLGEGGMGIVYRAEHLHLRKLFAIKVLLPEWSSMPEVVARFEREAVAAGNIESPHVVAATDFGRLPGGAFFLAMEHVNGRMLRTVLEGGALEPARALHVLRGIVSALQAAHALGIVHRDLKPENIMLVERDADADFVKVLDFGIAKIEAGATLRGDAPNAPLTRIGAVIGTPDYMSPEQALGQPVDARSDLYSAGVILFEMLAGRLPFAGGAVTVLGQRVMGNVPELPPDVGASGDPRIAGIARQLLAVSPENRFASAADLMTAIDERPNDRERPAPPAVMRKARESLWHTLAEPEALLRLVKRRRLVIAAIALAVGVVIIAVLAAGGPAPAPASAAAPTGTGPAPVAGPTTASSTPTSEPMAGGDIPPFAALPPPPAPSSSSAPARTHKTGPGGIYIPPPSQWFK
jgi:eukaryotic-like serine/threonine-protein kinase